MSSHASLAKTAVGLREIAKRIGLAPLSWEAPPRRVLIVTKLHDRELVRLTLDAARWLAARGMAVSIQRALLLQQFLPSEAVADTPATSIPSANPTNNPKSQIDTITPPSCSSNSTSQSPFSFGPTSAPTDASAASLLPQTPDGALPPTPASALPLAHPALHNHLPSNSLENLASEFHLWDPEFCASDNAQDIDFVITFGGDGTVLFAAWLFQKKAPPIIPFNLGSLGFLTVFDHSTFKKTIQSILENEAGMRMNFRMRFACTVHRRKPTRLAVDDNATPCKSASSSHLPHNSSLSSHLPHNSSLSSHLPQNSSSSSHLPHNSSLSSHLPHNSSLSSHLPHNSSLSSHPPHNSHDGTTYHILNDLVVDRGPSPYLSQLEIYGNERHLTTVQADGLVIATPTGSTAYSLSAGGSVVHPDVSAILVTPICPHTLSFRPMILPDTMDVKIVVPVDSRATAWASFDGHCRVQLNPGDWIQVCASPFPIPTVCRLDQSSDWLNSLETCLAWNRRERQKKFDI